MQNKQVEGLFNELGATAEMCHIFYTHLIAHGFSESLAMTLTNSFLSTTLGVNLMRPPGGDA